MRILYVVHQFYPEFSSGTERVTLNLAKAAQRANNHVEVLTCSVRGGMPEDPRSAHGWRRSTVQGIPVHAIPGDRISDPYGFEPGKDASVRDGIHEYLAAGRFDLVHVTHALRMLDAVACVRERRIPYVMTLTDFFTLCYRINLNRLDASLCNGPVEGEACRRHCAVGSLTPEVLRRRYGDMVDLLLGAEDCVVCSSFVADVFARELPQLATRTIEHGIDLLRFRPRGRSADDVVTFGFLGTLSRAKGVDVLVDAFAAVKAPNIRLHLVGDFHGNDVEPHIRRVAQSDPRISLGEPIDAAAVPTTLAGFDVNCLPSILPETFSLVLHEGFAAGLPPIASDVGNLGATVRRHGCGQLVPVGSVEGWRDAIEAIAAKPEILERWRLKLPLPMRQEEETFLYSQIYAFAQRRQGRDLGRSKRAVGVP